MVVTTAGLRNVFFFFLQKVVHKQAKRRFVLSMWGTCINVHVRVVPAALCKQPSEL